MPHGMEDNRDSYSDGVASLRMGMEKSKRTIYYDNGDIPEEHSSEEIEVERIYCFDWDTFTDKDWNTLEQIYFSLPGNCQYQELPYWYGDSEENIPFLNASVEPPGLQVYGILNATEFLEWDNVFREKAKYLPMRHFKTEHKEESAART